MVDYAHNEMSLRSVLTTLREYEPGRLVCVFGCGGNRSKERRFTMGQVSGELSDLTIITSDNPRFEEPKDIIADIITGIGKAPSPEYVVVEDRYEAIKYSLEHAKKGDLILVAGKGHEDYQEIKGVKYHMDDTELIRKAADELKLS
jgi:UDP-N-acetylmuramoyl-L-alanyl-D-glutamate--2,6-diaminopimelate ligase